MLMDNYKIAHNVAPVVLVVEDDEMAVHLYRTMLAGLGLNIQVARNGNEALERLAQSLPSLVLLDLILPHKSGLQICRQIRAMRSAAELPVIIITAQSDQRTRQAGQAAGANLYLTKPVLPSEILSHVRTYLPHAA